MKSKLLAGSLRHRGFEVHSCRSEISPIVEFLQGGSADVVVISCAALYSTAPDVAMVRTLHLMYPQIPKVCLLDIENAQLAVQAFRSGARGLFCLENSSFQLFCECIERVHRGEIFATNQQLSYLLDSVCQSPCMRVLSATGATLLTSREEQVVALVTVVLSNCNVVYELGLCEHTVETFYLRIFDKHGISIRVV